MKNVQILNKKIVSVYVSLPRKQILFKNIIEKPSIKKIRIFPYEENSSVKEDILEDKFI